LVNQTKRAGASGDWGPTATRKREVKTTWQVERALQPTPGPATKLKESIKIKEV